MTSFRLCGTKLTHPPVHCRRILLKMWAWPKLPLRAVALATFHHSPRKTSYRLLAGTQLALPFSRDQYSQAKQVGNVRICHRLWMCSTANMTDPGPELDSALHIWLIAFKVSFQYLLDKIFFQKQNTKTQMRYITWIRHKERKLSIYQLIWSSRWLPDLEESFIFVLSLYLIFIHI